MLKYVEDTNKCPEGWGSDELLERYLEAGWQLASYSFLLVSGSGSPHLGFGKACNAFRGG